QLADPIRSYTDQGKDFKASRGVDSSKDADKSTNDQDTDKKASVEANPIHQTPQEETTQEKVTTLPTLLMGPDGDELHNAPTWEGPPTGTQDEARPSFSPAIAPREAMKEDILVPNAFQQEVE